MPIAHPYIGVDIAKDWIDVFDPETGRARHILSATLIAGLPELGRMDRREIASLSGRAPQRILQRQTPNLGRTRQCAPHTLPRRSQSQPL